MFTRLATIELFCMNLPRVDVQDKQVFKRTEGFVLSILCTSFHFLKIKYRQTSKAYTFG